jgi:hypothetical protein
VPIFELQHNRVEIPLMLRHSTSSFKRATIMTKQLLLTTIIFVLTTATSLGQLNEDYLLWSSSRKFTLDDFAVKTRNLETTTSFGQFSMDYQVNGFDFLTKSFNKNVRNRFIKTASWIDTTTNVQRSLVYQQTLFDICEIYTRQFRKALKENRKRLANGKTIAEDLNNKFMTGFAKRRIDYDRETKFGADELKQKEWQIQIHKELTELSDYAYDK